MKKSNMIIAFLLNYLLIIYNLYMASNLPLFNYAAIHSRVLNTNMVFLKANDACKS